MRRVSWIATAALAIVVGAAQPAAAGDPGSGGPDPVYRYKDLGPVDGLGPIEQDPPLEVEVTPRRRGERIVRSETRIETTTRYYPPRTVAAGYRPGPRPVYGPPRRHRYYGPPRRRGYHGRPYGRRVYRGPCVRRVVRYTPRGKVIRIVNRCGPYRPHRRHGRYY